MARIVMPKGYLMDFNLPRETAHTLVRTSFPNKLRRYWRPLDGLAVWDPRVRGDVIHTINKIPITRTPWLVTAESSVPRTFGPGAPLLGNRLRRRLLAPNCLRIVHMSAYSRKRFVSENAGWKRLDEALLKSLVLHPTMPIKSEEPRRWIEGDLQVVFIGNDWARKGGVVLARAAELARDRALPIQFHNVSAMRYGAPIHTDADRSRYGRDVALLEGSNVTHHGQLSNDDVLALIARSHIQVMATLHDTYGFSILEGFSVGLPAITTDINALPEFVVPGQTGWLLPLPQTETGDRDGTTEWADLDATYDDLAAGVVAALESVVENPGLVEELGVGSQSLLRSQHDPSTASAVLNGIYDEGASLASPR